MNCEYKAKKVVAESHTRWTWGGIESCIIRQDDPESYEEIKKYLEDVLYYGEDSDETILIEGAYGTYERLLRVKGMYKHDERVIETLRSKDIWSVDELRHIEGW